MHEDEIGTVVVDCAVRLHRELGPGLFESVYETLLAHLLQKEGFDIQRQVPVPIQFDGLRFDEGFRADMIVENKVLLELKSVETLSKVHHKQLLTYLRLTDLKVGYLLNFGDKLMKNGISRIINGQLDRK